ncbi:hypothetical protein Y032_0014g2278 [Ancylostoma ceylanicum]|uniref:CCHC-type domain-containing protein n=1 Tax=Ancylostoma ceylanicum TaxID=53326 RepID=A0A016VAN1_9BILA|nr:hypothetical protein Y032_0014g2278 [Ancylostoma ceylanicum]
MSSTEGYLMSSAGIPCTVMATSSSRHADTAAQVSLSSRTLTSAQFNHPRAAAQPAAPCALSTSNVAHSPHCANPLATAPSTLPQPYTCPVIRQSQASASTSAQPLAPSSPCTASVEMEDNIASISQNLTTQNSANAKSALTFASMDLRSLLSILETVASVDSAPQLHALPKPIVSRQHFFDAEGPDPLNNSPRLGSRVMTPFEACFLYAQGKYELLDVTVEKHFRSHQFATPPYVRSALRLAQTLTVVDNFDYTFNISHLSARDLMMIDAFLRDDIYTHLRDTVAGEATIPLPASQTYPCTRDLPIRAVILSLKDLHAATLKLTDFRMHLFKEVDQWQSPEKVLDALEHLAKLLHHLDHCRAALDMHITPHTTASPEGIRNFVNILAAHNASPLSIAILYNAATAELAHAYTVHQSLINRFRCLCSPERKSLEPDSLTIPQTSQTNVWTPATTVPPSSNHSLVHSTSTVVTAIQTSHSASSTPSALADATPNSAQPALADTSFKTLASLRSATLRPSAPAAAVLTNTISTPAANTPPNASDCDTRPRDKHPDSFKDVQSVTHRFSRNAPAKSAKPHYRKELTSQSTTKRVVEGLSDSSFFSQPASALSPFMNYLNRPPEESSLCKFCSEDHSTLYCEVVKSLTDRCRIIADAGRCIKCLMHHPQDLCRYRKIACYHCKQIGHHNSLCKNNKRVINDVTGDLDALYKRTQDLSEAKFDELYKACRR